MIIFNDKLIHFEGIQVDLIAEYAAIGEYLYKELNNNGQIAFIIAMEKLVTELNDYEDAL